jgi:hypothetical protein
MEVLWLLHHGLTQEKVAKIVGVGLATVKRYANAYRDGGLDGLRRWERKGRAGSFEAGRGHVFFVDAAHFVFGTFLGCLWSFGRLFVRAASGRQRFNVLGAWNAVTRELIAVTNTTVVNTETMCALLRQVAARGLVGPITLVRHVCLKSAPRTGTTSKA